MFSVRRIDPRDHFLFGLPKHFKLSIFANVESCRFRFAIDLDRFVKVAHDRADLFSIIPLITQHGKVFPDRCDILHVIFVYVLGNFSGDRALARDAFFVSIITLVLWTIPLPKKFLLIDLRLRVKVRLP